MSSNYGSKIKVQIFGQSHSPMLGVTIDGLPPDILIDMPAIEAFLKRRQGGQAAYTTPRKEEDNPQIISGLFKGKTCGAPLTALFANQNIRSEDYSQMLAIPRPSHADYVAYIKYLAANDYRGGGHFSGRMTLPICFAGAICKQILAAQGIIIESHIAAIGMVEDIAYDPLASLPLSYNHPQLAVYDEAMAKQMEDLLLNVAAKGDSIGGMIETRVLGLPIGIGEPIFNGLESEIAACAFAIPAIKGIEFGAGFKAATMYGSEHNDSYYYDDGCIKTATNRAGGILGGISTGNPLIFKVAIKPTPSIGIEQKSVDLQAKQDAILAVKGRHDPCIVPRAVPCLEAITAIAIINLI